ncbi:MAG: hypothetical protein IPK81_14050 [Rhodospirillales bacterium]|nr:MAG: hypothetical protein IPK81_14050 [Rhodospirillales bacterium]
MNSPRMIDMIDMTDDRAGAELATRPRQDERDLLGALGAALYGEQWRGPMCHALGVNRRVLDRFMAATLKPDGDCFRLYPDQWAELERIADANRERLDLAARVSSMTRRLAGT